MNEGHASFLALELLRDESGGQSPQARDWKFDAVRKQCVFTTHTPVAAGHDQFDYGLVRTVVRDAFPMDVLQMLGGSDRLNMTLLALNLSHYVNGVARRHGEVSREMFPGQPIQHITNGVHTWTWAGDAMRRLFEKYIPGWADDPASLRNAIDIPNDDIWAAHMESKSALLDLVQTQSGAALSPETLTIGFARRATQYKRADLIFSDPDRLVALANARGPLQLVFAGKAHPKDHPGKELIRKIAAVSSRLRGRIEIRYLQNYDVDMARLIVSGVDLWLNTPQRPLEASGTSGMKAALNGVPSLSTLDGWWIEGHVEGVTGWAIGGKEGGQADDGADLYRKLEQIIPMFYERRTAWTDVMRHAIALNASYFNTHRMVQQYVTNAYLT
jgi:starch phosphorylase